MKLHQVPRIYDIHIRPDKNQTCWKASWHIFEIGPKGEFWSQGPVTVLEEEFRDPASAADALAKLLPREPIE